jgi:hypothetical protein
MKHRVAIGVAVLAFGLVGVGSAAAFDCIRVSSSLQGLKQSTAKSGNWLLFDLSTPKAATETFANISGGAIQLTSQQASCFVNAYAASGQPRFWALGIGVAGGQHGGPGVLAHNNKNTSVLGNNKGIDHFENSGIVPAVFAAGETCGIDLSGLE